MPGSPCRTGWEELEEEEAGPGIRALSGVSEEEGEFAATALGTVTGTATETAIESWLNHLSVLYANFCSQL